MAKSYRYIHVSAFAPIKDVLLISRPDLLGFLFLSPDYAFSFYWWLRTLFFLLSSLEFFYLLTNDYKISFCGMLTLFFIPPIQWWYSQSIIWMMIASQWGIVFFVRYLNHHGKKRFLYLGLFMWMLLIYIMTMYPAIQIPLGYLMLTIFLYILYRNKHLNPLGRKRCIEYFIFFLPIAFLLYRFYMMSHDAITTILQTNYPGSIVSWRTTSIKEYLYSFVSVFLCYHYPSFSNPSEISKSLTFFPFLLILSLAKRRSKNFPKLIKYIFVIAFCFFVFTISNIEEIRPITFLSKTYATRTIMEL